VGGWRNRGHPTDRALESVRPAGGGAVVVLIFLVGRFRLGAHQSAAAAQYQAAVVGHGKGLPLNRRGGELYGENAISDDALICQERRTAFWVDELRGFTQGKAERPRDFLFREVGGLDSDLRCGWDL
jgi:hypothetical protein